MTAIFWTFFVLPRAAFEIRFLIVVPAEFTKWVRFYSRRVIKMKNMKLLRQLFYAGFISFQRKKRKTNIDVNGGHCRITIQWFCTTWRKVADRVAWILCVSYKVKYFDKYNVCEKYDLSQTFLGRPPLTQLNYRDANLWRSQIWRFFFRLAPPPPRPNSSMRPLQKIPFLIWTPTSNFARKTWIYLSGSSIGWILIQSDSHLYNGGGQGSGSPGEEGTGEGRKRENRGREAGSIWGWEAGAEIKKAIVCSLLLGIIQSKTLI